MQPIITTTIKTTRKSTKQPSIIIEIINLFIDQRLKNISQQVYAGEQIHLIGANGSGKSSLISVLSGYLLYQGQIFIDGHELAKYSAPELATIRSYLLQQSTSIPALKVFQFLSLCYSTIALDSKILELLCDDFQIHPLLSKSVEQLSGGEWQRVKIIAAFLQVWKTGSLAGHFILFDEPKNNLDIVHQANLDKWIKYFCHREGTVIMSGHDLNHSYEHASRIWLMRQGELLASGQPEYVMTEKNLSDVFGAPIKLSEKSTKQFWQVINFDG
ncbi:ATP-binding cassette domain-containing protein [Moellerella wisconsensis]|uniref:vitamin B12 ABC transporter ATP-binding protein BtuD n=1 Tax=Moellerella wisconsensis TaxID=158849 RepID=UPI003076286D